MEAGKALNGLVFSSEGGSPLIRKRGGGPWARRSSIQGGGFFLFSQIR